MIDNVYKNAFKEVYEILQNTEEGLIKKVPKKFIVFLQNNMNTNYSTIINNNIEIDKQSILPETEAILSLLYRSYWATDEEKSIFSHYDKQEILKIEKNKKMNAKFSKKNLNNVTLDNSLIVIEKENCIYTFFKKIFKIFLK